MQASSPLRSKFNQMKKIIISYILAYCVVQLVNAQGDTGRATPAGISKQTLFTVRFPQDRSIDTITLMVHSQFNNVHTAPVDTTITSVTTNGKALFTIPDLTKPTRISVKHTNRKINRFGKLEDANVIQEYLIAPGDSIVLHSNYDVYAFTGKGSERMRCWHELMQSGWIRRLEAGDFMVRDSTGQIESYLREERFLEVGLRQIEARRPTLSQQDYAMLRSEWIGRYKGGIYMPLVWFNFSVMAPSYGTALLRYYEKHFLEERVEENPDSVWLESPAYGNYLYFKTLADEKYKILKQEKNWSKLPPSKELFKAVINKKFCGILKDRLLIQWALNAGLVNDEYSFLNKHVTNEYYNRYLQNEMETSYMKGIKLMDFAFEDQHGRQVQLSDYKGKVVFIDMWFSGCGGCKQVAQSVAKLEETYAANKDVVFLSISVDKDKDLWLSSIEKDGTSENPLHYWPGQYFSGNHTHYLYTAGRGRDDSFIKRYNPLGSYPNLLLIDRDGRMYSSSPPRPDAPSGSEKLQALINEALKND